MKYLRVNPPWYWLFMSYLLFHQHSLSKTSDNLLLWELWSIDHTLFESIESGKPQGLLNSVNLLIMQHLKGQFVEHIVPFSKVLTSEGNIPDNACVLEMIKTPAREKNYIFSDPISLHLSHRLYQQNDASPLPDHLLNKNGEIENLSDLFKEFPQALLVRIKGQSHGNEIDWQLSKIKDENQLLLTYETDVNSHINIFVNRGIDFVIEYPIYFTENVEQAESYPSYKIAQNRPYILGRFMCSKTERGQEIVHQINASLKELYPKKAFLDVHKTWVHSHLKKEFSQYFNHVFIEGNLDSQH